MPLPTPVLLPPLPCPIPEQLAPHSKVHHARGRCAHCCIVNKVRSRAYCKVPPRLHPRAQLHGMRVRCQHVRCQSGLIIIIKPAFQAAAVPTAATSAGSETYAVGACSVRIRRSCTRSARLLCCRARLPRFAGPTMPRAPRVSKPAARAHPPCCLCLPSAASASGGSVFRRQLRLSSSMTGSAPGCADVCACEGWHHREEPLGKWTPIQAAPIHWTEDRRGEGELLLFAVAAMS